MGEMQGFDDGELFDADRSIRYNAVSARRSRVLRA
jgi:hypothetical protein